MKVTIEIPDDLVAKNVESEVVKNLHDLEDAIRSGVWRAFYEIKGTVT
jgi:hypothetical protein